MECSDRNCDGQICMNKGVDLSIGARAVMFVFPCSKCGKMHYANGSEAKVSNQEGRNIISEGSKSESQSLRSN